MINTNPWVHLPLLFAVAQVLCGSICQAGSLYSVTRKPMLNVLRPPSSLTQLSPTTGSTLAEFPQVAVQFGGLTYDRSSDTLFGASNDGLYEVDRDTGQVSIVGDWPFGAGVIGSAAIDPRTSDLWISRQVSGGVQLIQLDVEAVTVKRVESIRARNVNAAAFLDGDRLLVAETRPAFDDALIWEVDTISGLARPLRSVEVGLVTGMAFGEDGVLYASVRRSVSEGWLLSTIDLEDGSVDIIAPLGSSKFAQNLAFVVPEQSSALLAAAALTLVHAGRKRRAAGTLI